MVESGRKKADWSVLLYLSGQTSLAQENIFNLIEMKNALTEMCQHQDKQNLYVIAWLETNSHDGIAYDLTKKIDESTKTSLHRFHDKDLTESVLRRAKEHKTGNEGTSRSWNYYPQRIIDFAESVIAGRRANHYALILSG